MEGRSATLRFLRMAIQSGDRESAVDSTRHALDLGMDVNCILVEGLGAGMADIRARFDRAEAFLPQIVAASKAMEASLEVIGGLMPGGPVSKGTVIMGTVRGDIHEIGKGVCCAMLRGAGYRVLDLGRNVTPQCFVEAASSSKASVIGASALMTTTLESQRELVRYMREVGVRYKAVLGGAPCSKAWCEEVGADGYSETAADLVALVDKLCA